MILAPRSWPSRPTFATTTRDRDSLQLKIHTGRYGIRSASVIHAAVDVLRLRGHGRGLLRREPGDCIPDLARLEQAAERNRLQRAVDDLAIGFLVDVRRERDR